MGKKASQRGHKLRARLDHPSNLNGIGTMSYAPLSWNASEQSNQGPDTGTIWFGDNDSIASHVYLTNGEELYHSPVVDAQAIPNFNGYYIVTADGCVFNFGHARYHGSLRGRALTAAIGRMMLRDQFGYALVDEEGAVFPFGDYHA